jgi:hypothetical protein
VAVALRFIFYCTAKAQILTAAALFPLIALCNREKLR